MGQQRSAGLGGKALLPEVLERGTEDPDHPGAPTGQGAGDRVRLVAEVGGHLAYAFLRLLGHLNAPKGVGNRRGGQPCGVSHLADRHTLGGRRHCGKPIREALT